MDKDLDIFKAIKQHLEIDELFTGDLGVRGQGLDMESLACESQEEAQPAIPAQQQVAQPAQAPKPVRVSAEPVIETPIQTEQKTPVVELPAQDEQKEGLSVKDVVKELQKIAKQVSQCRACELGDSRMNPVPGEGNPNARIVFVGEAPGAEEDKTGRPFVGRAGKLLTSIIEAMGLTREDVFICNTLKCRPPGNRDPKVSEKAACRHFLSSQLELIKPEIIVALGSHAAKELLETDKPIGQLRGRFHEFCVKEGEPPIKLMPTYHPSYLLRNYNYDSRKRVWEDMQTVLKELGLPVPTKNKK